MLNPFYLDKICVMITKVEGKYKEKRFLISAKNVWRAGLELTICDHFLPQVTIATAELIIFTDSLLVNDNLNSKNQFWQPTAVLKSNS